MVFPAGSLRYHGCSKVIYSAKLLSVMEKIWESKGERHSL